jgi:hypothetical protein
VAQPATSRCARTSKTPAEAAAGQATGFLLLERGRAGGEGAAGEGGGRRRGPGGGGGAGAGADCARVEAGLALLTTKGRRYVGVCALWVGAVRFKPWHHALHLHLPRRDAAGAKEQRQQRTKSLRFESDATKPPGVASGTVPRPATPRGNIPTAEAWPEPCP